MYKTENGVLRLEVVYQNSLGLLQTLQRASFSRLCDPRPPLEEPHLSEGLWSEMPLRW